MANQVEPAEAVKPVAVVGDSTAACWWEGSPQALRHQARGWSVYLTQRTPYLMTRFTSDFIIAPGY